MMHTHSQKKKQRSARPTQGQAPPLKSAAAAPGFDLAELQLEKPSSREGILQRQRLQGNQAVAKLMAKPKAAPKNRIQRAEESIDDNARFGLALPSNITTFASAIHNYAKDNPEKTLGDLIGEMEKQSAAALSSAEVSYKPNYVRNDLPGTTNAQFNWGTWTISIDPTRIHKDGQTAKLKDIKPERVARAANSMYHETRHCEQFYLIARMLAGQGQSPKTINQGTAINFVAAFSASLKPLKRPGWIERHITGNAADMAKRNKQMDMAQIWYDSAFGKYKGFRTMTSEVKARVKEMMAYHKLAEADQTWANFHTHYGGAIQKLKNSTIPDHITTMRDKLGAVAKPNAYEKRMKKAADDMFTAAGKLSADYDASKEDVAMYNKLKSARAELSSARYDGYRAYSFEMDAWATGGAVQDDMNTMEKSDEIIENAVEIGRSLIESIMQ